MADRRQRRRHRNPLRVILRWMLLFLAVILILIVGISYAQGTVNVTGDSMYPSLQPGDRAFSETVSYLVREPARGDIVQFSTAAGSGRALVRRIVGLPGETVQIIGGKVYINGAALDESAYATGEIQYAGTASIPHTLSQDAYFVMADNRSSSFDSRDPTVGDIHKSEIKGRLWLRYAPLWRFGLLE